MCSGYCEDLGFAVAGRHDVAGLFAGERAGERRHVRNGALRRIGLVFADDAEGLTPSIAAFERDCTRPSAGGSATTCAEARRAVQ